MSKSKILIDRLAKLIEEGLITSKDIGEEIRNWVEERVSVEDCENDD